VSLEGRLPRAFACGTRFMAGPSDAFGFSWTLAVSVRKPRSDVLDFLGFPWILSSESSLFNGLSGIKRRSFFPRRFPQALEAREWDPCGFGRPKRRIVHRASLIQFLIFCKNLSSQPLLLGRLDPKAARSTSLAVALANRLRKLRRPSRNASFVDLINGRGKADRRRCNRSAIGSY
jgi:hypothetical protein